MNDAWSYNKAEDLTSDELRQFSHLLIESKDKGMLRGLTSTTHKVVKEIQAFKGTSLNYKSFPIVQFNFSPAVTILQKINTN